MPRVWSPGCESLQPKIAGVHNEIERNCHLNRMFVFPRSHPNINWLHHQSVQSTACGADSKSCERGKDAGIHPYQYRQTVVHCKNQLAVTCTMLSAECTEPTLDTLGSLTASGAIV